MSNSIPRRIRVDLYSPAEKAIYDAIQEVEDMGADEKLTDAVILLSKAQDKVADFVDSNIEKLEKQKKCKHDWSTTDTDTWSCSTCKKCGYTVTEDFD